MAEKEFSLKIVGVDWQCECGDAVEYVSTETFGSHLHSCKGCRKEHSLNMIYPTTRMSRIGTLQ